MSADDFSDVFSRDERDSGADNAAPASDRARDEAGRFAAKTEAPAVQPEATAETPAQQPVPPVSDPAEQSPNRMVPLSELLAERDKRKGEAKAREETTKQYEDRIARLEANYQRFSQPQPQAQQPQQQVEIPDPLMDPQGYARHVEQTVMHRFIDQQLHQSEARARATHGDELANQAIAYAKQTGANKFFLKAAEEGRTADAWGDMITWFTKQQALAKVGDPQTFEKQIREDERKKARDEILAEMKRGAPQPKFPGSLADATATGAQGQHLSMEAAASSVFAREPRR